MNQLIIYHKTLHSKFVLLSIIFCLAVPAPSQSASATEPTDQMKQTIDAVIKVLENKELKKPRKDAERRSGIEKIVDGRFDFRKMARSVLAIYWAKRTPAEKKEFVSLFADLIKDTYIKKIEMYSGEKVLYAGESVNNGYAVVKTRIASKTGNEIPIDYMMLDENGTWMIYDVLIEGVSLVNNYKAQFAEIINSGSYEELVRKLKNKELTKSK